MRKIDPVALSFCYFEEKQLGFLVLSKAQAAFRYSR